MEMDLHKVVSQLPGKHMDMDFRHQRALKLRGAELHQLPFQAMRTRTLHLGAHCLKIKITSAGDSVCTRLKRDNLLVES